MRTFTKKRGLFVVAAALLIVTAMLGITWCSNGISNGNNTDEYTPPPGKGAVRLNFNNEIARTILPDNADLDDFDSFDFVFSPNPTGTSLTKEDIAPTNLHDPIVLDPGDYTLTVIAHIDSVAMAKNDSAVSVTITAAKTTSAEIVLKPYDQTTGTGNGTFKYEITGDIDEDEDIISAVMNLTPIVAGAARSDIDISGEFNDGDEHELSVKAGDYYLDVVVEVASGDTVTFRHIVHIYQNIVSSYVFIIDRNYFNAVFELVDSDLTYEGPDEDIRWKQRFHNYKKVFATLKSAVELAKTRNLTDLEKQGMIQGFEFTFEMAWNVMKDYLEEQGIIGIIGSKGTVRHAFNNDLIKENTAGVPI